MKLEKLLIIGVAVLVAGWAIAQQRVEPRPLKLRVSQGVMDGLLIHKVEPEYPETARAQRISGTVILRVQIDTEGHVAQIDIIGGHPLLAEAAANAVKQWQFKPYLLNGEPIAVETTETLSFGQGSPELPIKLRADVMAGNLIREVAPVYPPRAKAGHIQGEVILEAMIDTKGNVAELKISSGHPLLAEAALDAVKQWKYKPYELNRKPVEVETTIMVRFQM
jgi:TonB family protein